MEFEKLHSQLAWVDKFVCFIERQRYLDCIDVETAICCAEFESIWIIVQALNEDGCVAVNASGTHVTFLNLVLQT